MYSQLLLGPISKVPVLLIVIFLAWTIFWKGLALWKSARYSQKYWFIAILVISSLGILEIIYLALFQKKTKK